MKLHDARALEIIKTIRYATVATASKAGKPWNSPVGFAYDSNLNIYWLSDKSSQHSQNIRDNKEVFIVICDPSDPRGDEGLYIEARAQEVDNPEEVRSIRTIMKGASDSRPADDFLGEAVRRVYKAVPQRVWMNDAEINDGVFVRDYRVQIPLEPLQEGLGA